MQNWSLIKNEFQSKFERWLHLLKFGELYARRELELPEVLKMEEGMEMVLDAIEFATSDRHLRYILLEREIAEHDRATEMDYAISEGIKKGEREGIKKGERKGRKEGKKEVKLEIAKKLLDLLDSETIAKKLDLSIDDIEKLKK